MKRFPIVYLAGGMRSGWQDVIKTDIPNAIYIDPRVNKLLDERNYTGYDLSGVIAADIIFAYMERDNPAGHGMAVEIGYAAALGKTIIYVEDTKHPNSRYFGMMRTLSTKHDYIDGIECLSGSFCKCALEQVILTFQRETK